MKKWMIWLCLVLCLILPVSAMAQVQPDKTASLTLRLTENGAGLEGATFSVYRVAEMDADARFTLLSGYDAGDVDINRVEGAAAWQSLADELADQVKKATATATTNADGLAKISKLKTGLYLVIGKPVEIGTAAYDFSAFMVAVPGKSGDDWTYDVVADVKYERTTLTCNVKIMKVWSDEGYTKVRPSRILADLRCDGEVAYTVELNASNNWTYEFIDLESAHEWTVTEQVIPSGYEVSYSQDGDVLIITNTLTTPPTATPDIPQTGLVWWPVPVMAVLGLTLVIIGWAMCRKWRNEHDQA